MVGVPGRSKACHTCRTRRIACSLDTPQCKQCLKSNRVCGGYKRERIWVPNNQVKLDAARQITPPELLSAKSSPQERRAHEQGVATAILANSTHNARHFSNQTVTILPRLTKTVDSIYPFHQQILAEFVYSFIPDVDKAYGITGDYAKDNRSWLTLIPDLPNVTPALEISMLALSSATMGRQSKNMHLVRESRKLYIQSLRELQKALYDPTLMYRDETLAACLTLAMYEVIECPAENGTGWLTHSNGCLQLIELRGPEAHASGLGHQLFLTCRHNAVSSPVVREPITPHSEANSDKQLPNTLATNRQTFLAQPKWMTLPWNGRSKTLSDRIEDIFVSGTAVLEAAAQLGEHKGSTYLKSALKVIDSCWKIDAALREIYKELEDSIAGPVFWPELSTQDNPADDVELGKVFPVAYQFPNLRVSYMCSMYWTICIILWGGLFNLYKELATRELEEDDGIDNPDGCHCTKLSHECGQNAAYFDVSELPPLENRDVLSAIHNICQTFEFCVRPENKGIGAASIAFPLQVAVATLKEYPGCERELCWARSSVVKLNEKGFRILKFAAE